MRSFLWLNYCKRWPEFISALSLSSINRQFGEFGTAHDRLATSLTDQVKKASDTIQIEIHVQYINNFIK